ncbi:unnamed protein product, partial [marine sediment metagenome]
ISWKTIKAPKRGNDVANRIVQRRLAPLKKAFEQSDFSLDGTHTATVYLTLTYDTKRCSRAVAWQNIGRELNLFLANLTKQYGKLSHLRAWESFENEYPHLHMVIHFHDTSFSYFKHEKNGKTTYRLVNYHRERLAKYWHSFVDVQAVCGNGVGRLKDVLSYVIKFKDSHVPVGQWNDKELSTMALTWYFRLRQYGVSGDFTRLLDTGQSILIPTDTIQIDLHGDKITVVEYEFLGMIKRKALDIGSEVHECSWRDRPPWLYDVWEPSR